ncbi:glycosyltransferase [Psychroserpens sp. XS_ASV72]|uniref:glycosyltransferase n=1 Tax=Psychroserpens sp. XS_ASV72 TaxID=3241293 RepID=UPI0035178A05
MRILLVGEYSRLHNSLKEGLSRLGHEVIIMGNRDNFKNYPVDIYVNHSFHHKILKKFRVGFYKLTSIDLGSLEIYLKASLKLRKLDHFDIVQLINESSLVIKAPYEKRFIKQLLKKSKKLFLLSTGSDYINIKYMLEEKFRYSILTPYLNDSSLEKAYRFDLQYLNSQFKALHEFIYEHCNGVIATDFDYHLPLVGHPRYLGLIPNPINIEKLDYIPFHTGEKIKIFHGVNKNSMLKKGNRFFEEALKIIEEKYKDKVEITTTYNIPYKEYLNHYENCHIFLDQVYAYDQGYNALEAMAKGKIVFTGAEKEWLEHYNLKEDSVAINALPDAEKIADKLDWLIQHQETMLQISKNARQFIEREHNFLNCAKQYLNTWSSN